MSPKTRLIPSSALRNFLAKGAAGGILLMATAALAMIVANSPLYPLYYDMLHAPIGPVLADKLGPMNAHLWINDALMAVFFLLVGLEIKRKFVDGQLTTWADRRLPFLAAAAGMILPAGVYLSVVAGALAFPGNQELIEETKTGVVMGSLLSALLGYAILRFAPLHPSPSVS